MANCQNNMRYIQRPMQAANNASSSCGCSPSPRTRTTPPASQYPCRMDGCPNTADFFPECMPVAMAYVPWQKWKNLYEPCKALECGTLFAELNKPFLGKGGRCR